MKKYKFTVKKILKDKVEIKAKNKNEAIRKIVQLLSIDEEILFKKLDEKNNYYEIKLNKISNISNEKIEEKNNNLDKVINKIIYQLEKDISKNYLDNNYEKDNKIVDTNEEIIDDLPKEYNEIVCEKCGNCILLDENILS